MCPKCACKTCGADDEGHSLTCRGNVVYARDEMQSHRKINSTATTEYTMATGMDLQETYQRTVVPQHDLLLCM